MRDFYQLANEDGIKRYFGNHRKYESIDPNKRTSTIFVFNSYISWIGGDHLSFFQSACKTGLINPSQGLFDCLFHKMSSVLRFGRMARFDYLTMLGKLGLLDVEPQRAYLEGSSGPVNGARLIYGNDPVLSVQDLEDKLAELAVVLQLGAYNMQILEDAICNWQKNPERYMHFRG
jgi:hypothetical protein